MFETIVTILIFVAVIAITAVLFGDYHGDNHLGAFQQLWSGELYAVARQHCRSQFHSRRHR